MGGITAGQVNIGPQPRRLDANLKSQLLQAIPKSTKVSVTCIMGDGEAFQFAEEIRVCLVGAGYDVEGVNQAIFSQPVLGQIIEPGPEQFRVIIGTRQ